MAHRGSRARAAGCLLLAVLAAVWVASAAAAQEGQATPVPLAPLPVLPRPTAPPGPKKGDAVKGGRPAESRGGANEPEITLAPPGPEHLFRVQSEAKALEEVRQQRGAGVSFPTTQPPPAGATGFRTYPARAARSVLVPVCHGPLYFEDPTVERAFPDQSISPFQPLLSAGRFYADALLLPARLVCQPPWCTDCTLGETPPALPGRGGSWSPGAAPSWTAAWRPSLTGQR